MTKALEYKARAMQSLCSHDFLITSLYVHYQGATCTTFLLLQANYYIQHTHLMKSLYLKELCKF